MLPAGLRAGQEIAAFAHHTAGHYQVYAQSGRERAAHVNGFMNEMLKQYSRFFSNWAFKDGARVIVFSDADAFRAYASSLKTAMHPNTTGYCHLKTDEDGNTFHELVTYDHADLWQVLAHEGFHQFIGYELGAAIPIWLNEGMAQYFETSIVVSGKLQTGIIDRRRLLAAQHFIRQKKAMSLMELVQMDKPTFYANAETAYPASWALVYYLINREGSLYRNSAFKRYLQDLKYGKNAIGSFQQRFGRDIARWQPDFEQFILQLKPPQN
jgi:hypothetical protein